MTPEILSPIQLRPNLKHGHPGTTHPRWKGGDLTISAQLRYQRRNKDKTTERAQRYYKEVAYFRQQEIRKQALLKVGKGLMECSRCGCDNLPLLEINHINGCGHEERKSHYRSGSKFWKHILSDERKIDDLNILCKACNILYYIKLQYGVDNYEIKWK